MFWVRGLGNITQNDPVRMVLCVRTRLPVTRLVNPLKFGASSGRAAVAGLDDDDDDGDEHTVSEGTTDRRRRQVSCAARRPPARPLRRPADRRRNFLAPGPKKRGPPASLYARVSILCAKRSCAVPYPRQSAHIRRDRNSHFRNIKIRAWV